VLEPLFSDYDLERLNIKSRSTAQKDRVAGRGIPFIKIGRLVRYRPADVEKYLSDLRTLRSTSEADADVTQRRERSSRAVNAVAEHARPRQRRPRRRQRDASCADSGSV
jgi:hypothetical protein